MAGIDWSECPAVESIPGKVSGAWVLKGTRMPVSAIFENLEAGANIDDIMEWFEGLDRDQVRAVIEFAARSLDKPAVTSVPQNGIASNFNSVRLERPVKLPKRRLLRHSEAMKCRSGYRATPRCPLGTCTSCRTTRPKSRFYGQVNSFRFARHSSGTMPARILPNHANLRHMLEQRGITKSTCSPRAEPRSSNLCAAEGFGIADQNAGRQAQSRFVGTR
jgi:uncharacterized protein (DUF433 family)